MLRPSRARCRERRSAGRAPPSRGSRGSAGGRAPTAHGRRGCPAARRARRSRRGSAAPSSARPPARRTMKPGSIATHLVADQLDAVPGRLRRVRLQGGRPAASRRGTGTPACAPRGRFAALRRRPRRPGVEPGRGREPRSSRPRRRRPRRRRRSAPPLARRHGNERDDRRATHPPAAPARPCPDGTADRCRSSARCRQGRGSTQRFIPITKSYSDLGYEPVKRRASPAKRTSRPIRPPLVASPHPPAPDQLDQAPPAKTATTR